MKFLPSIQHRSYLSRLLKAFFANCSQTLGGTWHAISDFFGLLPGNSATRPTYPEKRGRESFSPAIQPQRLACTSN